MILPEYLVSFDYLLEDDPSHAQMSVLQEDVGVGSIGDKETLSDQELVDYAPFLPPLTGFVQQLNLGAIAHQDRLGPLSDAALGLSSKLLQRPKLIHISEEAVLAKTQVQTLSCVVHLNLHGLSISKIEKLNTCANLKTLVLSCNNIQRIEGLGALQQLRGLDLSFNLLKRITGLGGSPNLQTILLNNNDLRRVDDLNAVRCYTPGLIELDLRGNALSKEKGYRSTALRNLSSLQHLDGKQIQESERKRIKLSPIELTLNHIRLGAGKSAGVTFEKQDWLDVDSLLRTDSSWLGMIESLSVSYAGIARLQNLESLTQLRQASFSHNVLLSLDGLACCTALEDLSVEDNRISTCANLEACQALRKLDLSHNELHIIKNLEPLRHLTQLSLENNFISSLASVAYLTGLMELYLGNNDIEEVQEIDCLKHSPKLIIMDLSGNRLCSSQDYRLYVLFRLRRLKVLDGISVLVNESNQAREKFSGKLTRDLLYDRLENVSFVNVCQLEISSLKLRDLSILCELNFSSLRELNAENNHLCAFTNVCLYFNFR